MASVSKHDTVELYQPLRHMMQNELLTILSIVDAIRLNGTVSAAKLCELFDCSVPTLKRRIDDARNLGAHVESVKAGHKWVYHLANAEMVAPRLERWIELERARSLV